MKPVLTSPLCLSLAFGTVLALTACSQKASQPNTEVSKVNMTAGNQMASIQTAIACLPDEAALIAAHRGVSEEWDLPENSASGLQRLIDENYLVAEIDVASTKDGTLFLFHDGVWDETSTGKGPVSASTSEDLDKILLKSRQGTLASERPLRFDDALEMAKNKIYLEIDFKSSASEFQVIEMITEKGMGDQVVLIAYTSEQAEELQALAPNMLLSAPGEDKGRGLKPENTLLWMGRGIDSISTPTNTLAYIGMVGRKSETAVPGPLRQGKLLVTDFPTDFPPIWGLNQKTSQAYEACLSGNKSEGS
ncbi:glycerophosphodiester phosphodiesterase family protein [Litorimonas haliclonae]|uniref:glycerophosphodiester phosphodiesterase family protein n=1 Tax=Litorimonas haliclonae TaxID=2081977 RepID=UPI0039EED50E